MHICCGVIRTQTKSAWDCTVIRGGGRGGGCLPRCTSRRHLNMNSLKWRRYFHTPPDCIQRHKSTHSTQTPRGRELLRGPPGAAAFIRSTNMKPLRWSNTHNMLLCIFINVARKRKKEKKRRGRRGSCFHLGAHPGERLRGRLKTRVTVTPGRRVSSSNFMAFCILPQRHLRR